MDLDTGEGVEDEDRDTADGLVRVGVPERARWVLLDRLLRRELCLWLCSVHDDCRLAST